MANKKDPIAEANRHLRNADKLLKENCTVNDVGHYNDKKYVKMAGHTAWTGVLEALDPLHPPLAKNKRKSVDSYRKIFETKARKYLDVYNSAYATLHLEMSYDGITATGIKKEGWKQAKILINWADEHLPKSARTGLSGAKAK